MAALDVVVREHDSGADAIRSHSGQSRTIAIVDINIRVSDWVGCKGLDGPDAPVGRLDVIDQSIDLQYEIIIGKGGGRGDEDGVGGE